MELAIIVAVVCGIIGATIADEDQRGMGILLGALLGPIGLIIVAVMKGKS